ncbi:MAG: hypothetical protein MH825_13115 [Cyanobacteria bacterium]|nr:hypothetical protein [Cyanobacteriota bacterium]
MRRALVLGPVGVLALEPVRVLALEPVRVLEGAGVLLRWAAAGGSKGRCFLLERSP